MESRFRRFGLIAAGLACIVLSYAGMFRGPVWLGIATGATLVLYGLVRLLAG